MIDTRKFLANLGRNIHKVILPLYIERRKGTSHTPLSGKEDGIIVSLTSFPARMDGLWITLDSLMRQKVRPDKIVLTLTKEEYPDGMKSLPESVLKFLSYGLEILFLPKNLKCHNKYFKVMQTYPDADIITVDDDCLYRSDMIQRLVDLHERFPESVCCNIGAMISQDHFYEYKKWPKTTSHIEPSHQCVALGFAGVYYPRHIMRPETFDEKLFTRLAPSTDDLWLKANEILSGVKVTCGDLYPKPVTVRGSQKVSLRKTNKGKENQNDIQWKNLDEYFHLKELIF